MANWLERFFVFGLISRFKLFFLLEGRTIQAIFPSSRWTACVFGTFAAVEKGCSLQRPVFLFFMVYVLFGHKMRILSFQIVMLVLAAAFAALCGCRFYIHDYAYAITDLLIVGCLVGFVFTIKRTDATPRVLLIAAMALQIPLTIFSEVAYLSADPIDWAFAAEAIQMVVVHFVANGIYYSRIARHPIVDPTKAGEKSFK